MNLFQAIAQTLRALFGQAFVTFSWIEIEEDRPDRLVLNINTRRVVVDRVTRLISCSGRSITTFSSIQSIDVKHCRGSRGLEWWVVGLRLLGDRTERIGNAADEAQASIAAAHLSTVTGKPVRSVASWYKV